MTSSDPLAAAIEQALNALGVDHEADAETLETPRRVAALWRTWMRPAEASPALAPFTLPPGSSGPVVVRDLHFHSFCAHHLLPFFGHATVAFLPDKHLLGFGAFQRVVDHHAARLQLQERLVQDIAETIDEALRPRALLVRIQARQLCMEMGGTSCHSATTCWAPRGAWTQDDAMLQAITALGLQDRGGS